MLSSECMRLLDSLLVVDGVEGTVFNTQLCVVRLD